MAAASEPPELAARFARIRLLLLDVDGVMTDGRLLYDRHGDHGRSFHVRDGTAIKIAQACGIAVGIISGRDTIATARRGQDLGLVDVVQGRRHKEPAWEEVLARHGLADAEVAYMGDDVIDIPLLRRAGLAAAPRDAVPEVLATAHWVSSRDGGDSCVRDLIETMLKSRGLWTSALALTP
jgi:3-deoxy-D-manno-octulosonate 8-phosphate phosphatase (KDO 8-P phosphatase)